MQDDSQSDFEDRRQAARDLIDRLAGSKSGTMDERNGWFEEVYREAGGDAASVPWADLSAKPELVEWLAEHPGDDRTAIDIACGLGDHAEALAAAGYRTTAFDISETAIEWTRRRFPDSPVRYVAADLLDPPPDWTQAFDLVHECYTLQAMDADLRPAACAAIAALIRPGGRLWVYTRSTPEASDPEGPPWPLKPSELRMFDNLGLERQTERHFVVERPGRAIPHTIAIFRKA